MSGLQVGLGVARRLPCAEIKATRNLTKVLAGVRLMIERHIFGFCTTSIVESLVLSVIGCDIVASMSLVHAVACIKIHVG